MNSETFRIFRVVVLLMTSVILTSCAFGPKLPEPDDTTRSVVFGYFDVEEAPSWGGLDWVNIKRYKPEQSYYEAEIEDGLFYQIGVENGSVQVTNFGRDTRWYSNTRYTYDFGQQGRNETARIIKEPGVYFMGSYKYKHIDSESWFGPDKFKMVESDEPKEKELLQRLLKIMQDDSELSDYKHQIGMIKARLKQLK